MVQINLPPPRERATPEPGKCPQHSLPVSDYDDLVKKCPTEGCYYFEVRDDLTHLELWWVNCPTCNWTYLSQSPDKCTRCDQTEQARWDDTLREIRG